VEKKLWQTYGDSLDRLSFLAVVEADTRSPGSALSASLPLRFEIDQYRADQLGLLSRRSLGAAPAVEAVSADWRRGVLLTWDIRRLDFPDSPPSGFWRHGPSLLANWYGDYFTLEAESQWLDNRYDRDTSLYRSGSWESRAAVFARPWRPLKAGVRLFHSAEDSRYLDTVHVVAVSGADTLVEAARARYALSGMRITVQPSITVEWAAVYSASLSLAWSRGRYPMLRETAGRALAFPQYLDEDFEGWKPEATFSILSRRLFLNMSMAYEMHAPAASPHYFQGYSEGLGLVGHCAWKISSSMEIDVSGLWRRRLDNKPTPGEVQDMTSLSMGLVSRFH
ncbi:MAG TPA: hypothetical protein VK465_18485, partial [Fibrobacteria bacterium]|nr:hypothetical protein [Fibrobacteria bacterium]